MGTLGKIKLVLAIIFCAMFCYMFMDRYLFRGQLGELCFGRARRITAVLLRSLARWMEGSEPQPRRIERSPDKLNQTQTATDELVPPSRQPRPEYAKGRHDESPAETERIFDASEARKAALDALLRQNELPEAGEHGSLPSMFTDPERVNFDSDRESFREKPRPLPMAANGERDADKEPDPDDEDETAGFAAARPQMLDSGQGIGPRELDWIIALCNGEPVPNDKRREIVEALHALRDTEIQKSLLAGINGSDARIARFLDEAEREAGN